MRPLSEIEGCFQGVVPSYVATCSADGQANVTGVSIVHLLSPTRVGVSCQFMNKTLRNLRETGRAQLLVFEPQTLADYVLDVRFERLVESGPVFDRMDAKLESIAAQSGMTGTFILAGVVELEVLAWWSTAGEDVGARGNDPGRDPIEQLERIFAIMSSAADLDALFDLTFAALDEQLGLAHGFLLLVDSAEQRLYNAASRGFDHPHFGVEIAVGEGLYGTAAARRTAIRTGSMRRERRMVDAVARESAQRDPTHLALPGLADAESCLAVPLVTGERCFGVLCFQSTRAGAFTDRCEKTVIVVARHLTLAMAHLRAVPKDVELLASRPTAEERPLVTRIRFFESDGSVFVDDEYLIKGVAGRILWRVLSNYENERRNEFSSKEIRLDPCVGLPALKDNLEARLIALRKRLEERCATLAIEKTGRGRFRLEVSRALLLERKP